MWRQLTPKLVLHELQVVFLELLRPGSQAVRPPGEIFVIEHWGFRKERLAYLGRDFEDAHEVEELGRLAAHVEEGEEREHLEDLLSRQENDLVCAFDQLLPHRLFAFVWKSHSSNVGVVVGLGLGWE